MRASLARAFASTGRLRPREVLGFLRVSSLARSVVLLLAGALALLLVVNASTFVMIRRTADFNQHTDELWQVRRAARGVILNVTTAETAQRGYLLSADPELLTRYRAARAVTTERLDVLARLGSADPVTEASSQAFARIIRDKFIEMDRTVALASQGSIGQAVLVMRSGRGQGLTEQLETEAQRVDDYIGAELDQSRGRSERAALTTVVVNAIAGALILVLAGIVVILIRRYLAELNQAREAVVQANAGLEDTVRARTAALTRANEEVQRFAYIVSHDLRSPLVNVMGYTSELEAAGKTVDKAIKAAEADGRKATEDVVLAVREDMPEAIGFIRASTEKMDRLINAILKLSREGRRLLSPETLDMTGLIGRIADSVRHQVVEADGEIVVQPMPEFESDRLSVEQIFGNLIDNAVKYRQPDRPIRIEVTGRDLPGGWVEYDVADNGRGVADRDRERVFELFRRAGRQDQPGEGLGLAFVRNSVRRLGGEITLQSELGKGSTFRVKFPKRLVLEEAGDHL